MLSVMMAGVGAAPGLVVLLLLWGIMVAAIVGDGCLLATVLLATSAAAGLLAGAIGVAAKRFMGLAAVLGDRVLFRGCVLVLIFLLLPVAMVAVLALTVLVGCSTAGRGTIVVAARVLRLLVVIVVVVVWEAWLKVVDRGLLGLVVLTVMFGLAVFWQLPQRPIFL